MEATEFITTAFLAAVAEVFEHYAGQVPEVLPGADAAAGLGSVVGFSDQDVKGSLVLTATPHAVLALAPGGETDPADWLGELNNQVVGRLKNKVVPAGLLFQLSPPVTADGKAVRFRSADAATSRWAVRWAGGEVTAMLALVVPAGLTLTADESAVVAEEGSLNLF